MFKFEVYYPRTCLLHKSGLFLRSETPIHTLIPSTLERLYWVLIVTLEGESLLDRVGSQVLIDGEEIFIDHGE